MLSSVIDVGFACFPNIILPHNTYLAHILYK